MSVPAKRKSASKTKRGRAHQALGKIKLNRCPKCFKAVLPHRVCNFCGAYKGRETIKVKSNKLEVKSGKK